MLSRKKKPFHFKHATSSQKQSVWKELPGTGRILHGTKNQADILSDVSGTQCAAASVVAVAYSQAIPMPEWTPNTIHRILIDGTRRHEKCPDKDVNGFADVRQFFGLQVP